MIFSVIGHLSDRTGIPIQDFNQSGIQLCQLHISLHLLQILLFCLN